MISNQPLPAPCAVTPAEISGQVKVHRLDMRLPDLVAFSSYVVLFLSSCTGKDEESKGVDVQEATEPADSGTVEVKGPSNSQTVSEDELAGQPNAFDFTAMTSLLNVSLVVQRRLGLTHHCLLALFHVSVRSSDTLDCS